MSIDPRHPHGVSWSGLPDESRLQLRLDNDEMLVTLPPRGFGAFSFFCLPLGVAGAVVGSTAANQVLQGGGALSVLLLLFGSVVVLFAMLGFFEQTLQTKRVRVTRDGVRLFRSGRDAEGVRIRRDEAQELLAAHASHAEARALRRLMDIVRAGHALPA